MSSIVVKQGRRQTSLLPWFSVCVEYSLTSSKLKITKSIGFYRKSSLARRPPYEGRTAPQGTLQEHHIYYKTYGFLIISALAIMDLADRVLEAIFFTVAKTKKTKENINVRDGFSVAAVVANDYKPKVFLRVSKHAFRNTKQRRRCVEENCDF